MKKIWEKIIAFFEAVFSKLFEEKKPQTATPAEILDPVNETHDYGLETANVLLASRDFGWNLKPVKKRVILANTDKCVDKLTLLGMVAQWHGTGHSEWECLLAVWFINAVKEAAKEKEAADITVLFDRELTSATGTFSQKEIAKHLAPHFKKVSEVGDILLVELRIPQ